MKLSKRNFLGLTLGTALTALPLIALADGWQPKRPIDFTIMAGAGGGADQIARFVQSVVDANDMTNRPLGSNKPWRWLWRGSTLTFERCARRRSYDHGYA